MDSVGSAAESIWARRIPPIKGLLERATRMDFDNYLPEDILVKVDRASMLNSLEVRAPLLDYRVIEFAYGRVPPCRKATVANRKIILKELAARVLPPQFDCHRKHGFSIPLPSWLRDGPWREFFRETLLGSGHTPFDRKYVTGLLEGHGRGRSNSERLFALVLFELWRKKHGVAI